jgi:hypothetical protein
MAFGQWVDVKKSEAADPVDEWALSVGSEKVAFTQNSSPTTWSLAHHLKRCLWAWLQAPDDSNAYLWWSCRIYMRQGIWERVVHRFSLRNMRKFVILGGHTEWYQDSNWQAARLTSIDRDSITTYKTG